MNELNDETVFDFTYAPGISQEQIIGFEMAGAVWSSHLQDNTTIRIHVESTDELPNNLLGAALPGKKEKIDYEKLWKKMSEDVTSDNDVLAFANLPSREKEFEVLFEGVELDKTKEFRLTNANAKALDLLDDDRKKLDGYIVVNDLAGSSAVGWDYDSLRNSEIAENNVDFLSVAMHEIGHVLGFVSGIDDDGWLKVLTESREKGKEIKDDAFKFASPLDLFRYSNASGQNKLDISTGGNPFFSIDGGNTNLGNFANGEHIEFGGDGYQASHWRQNSSLGIMNPMLPTGERKNISDLDLTAIDVVGWDIDGSVSIDWQTLYQNALNNVETAIIEDRTKDIEKMVKESQYDGRRSRSSSRSYYSFQHGLWQTTILEESGSSEETGSSGFSEDQKYWFDPLAVMNQFDIDIELNSNVDPDYSPSNSDDLLVNEDEISDSQSEDAVLLKESSEEVEPSNEDLLFPSLLTSP